MRGNARFRGNGFGVRVSREVGQLAAHDFARRCSGVAKNRALPVSYAPQCLVPGKQCLVSGNWCLLCVMVIPIAPLARSKEKSIVSYGFA